jgi:pimeloyl-ACP methyl ester carboxylesterase
LGAPFFQILVRRHPEVVERLILSNTGVPMSYLVPSAHFSLAIISALPRSVAGALLGRALSKILAASPDDRVFWRVYLAELFGARLNKKDVLQNIAQQLDYHRSHRFFPGDLSSWPGSILLIESDNDVIGPRRRKALRETCLQSPVYTFHGTGHAPRSPGGIPGNRRHFLQS